MHIRRCGNWIKVVNEQKILFYMCFLWLKVMACIYDRLITSVLLKLYNIDKRRKTQRYYKLCCIAISYFQFDRLETHMCKWWWVSTKSWIVLPPYDYSWMIDFSINSVQGGAILHKNDCYIVEHRFWMLAFFRICASLQ